MIVIGFGSCFEFYSKPNRFRYTIWLCANKLQISGHIGVWSDSYWFCYFISVNIIVWQNCIHLSATCLWIQYSFVPFSVTCQNYFLLVIVLTHTSLGLTTKSKQLNSSQYFTVCLRRRLSHAGFCATSKSHGMKRYVFSKKKQSFMGCNSST
jgi:hypothetical protein